MRALRLILPFLLLLVLIWLGFWWYAQSQLVVGFHREEAKLREAGWTVSHGAIERGHSPLVARMSVSNLDLTPPGAPGARPTIDFPTVGAHIDITTPFTCDVELPHHFSIHSAQGNEIALDADVIKDDFRFDPDAVLRRTKFPFRGGTAHVSNLRVSIASSHFPIMTIGALDAQVTFNPKADANATSMSVRETFSNIAVSPLFVTLVHLPFNGRINQYCIAVKFTGPDFSQALDSLGTPPPMPASDPTAQLNAQLAELGARLRPWASHGGHGTFAVGLVIGPLDANLHGAFKFDQALQPEGTGTVTATGLPAFLSAIGTAQPRFANALAGATAAAAPFMVKGPDGHQKLDIALAVRNRALTLNGKPAATLPEINWPPAAPATR